MSKRAKASQWFDESKRLDTPEPKRQAKRERIRQWLCRDVLQDTDLSGPDTFLLSDCIELATERYQEGAGKEAIIKAVFELIDKRLNKPETSNRS